MAPKALKGTGTDLLLGFASRLVDWVLVLLGLPSVLLLVLFGRLKSTSHNGHTLETLTRLDLKNNAQVLLN